MNNTPQILYKYVSCDIAKIILETNAIRATPPIDFNDPFEVLPQSMEVTEALGRELINRFESKAFYDVAVKNKDITYQQYLLFLKTYPDKAIQILKDTFMSDDKFVMKVLKGNVEKYSELFGLLCLSAKRDNILMWSHYADNHRGVVIGFDSKKLFRHGYFKVRYSEERCFYNVKDERDINGLMELFATKARMWEYEDEYRALINFHDCIKSSAGIYLYGFNREAIKELIFGIRILESEKVDILRLISDCRNVSVMQANLHDKMFKIEFDDHAL
ncbi:hypothetical protein BIU88_02660 [Chlorobaculum limnaeum]|uniref:DUF2971 domain-containing protein n=1 Tax=Chlorobaculum limnaeum TaxID=274537 RepID=A0A1D8CYC3_CHLLM|nr:DUF2971 domain-containing protein [Chlorobaculum limnaeum]AOS83141.1 hypothetical protein BIU88_02660 [Chlorobaculum limnaeum]